MKIMVEDISARSADGETLQEAGRKKKQERRGSLRGSAKWRRVAMPTLEEWLTKTYGSDLSKVTEIKNVPDNVTGKFFLQFFLACGPVRTWCPEFSLGIF